MALVQELNPNVDVQLLIATHSPLVMGSVETVFNADHDKWLDLDLSATGDPAIEAELLKLEKDLQNQKFSRRAAVQWDKRLRTLLGESHPYWSRWRTFVDLKRWAL